MKGRLWFFGVLILAVVILSGYGDREIAAGGGALPGSEGDPVVTKSYVDTRLEQGLSFLVVDVPQGKSVIAGAGAEMILRTGVAKVIDSQSGGLCDVTAGADLRKGQTAPPNHLLIVPRDDGRGLYADTALIILVRGPYSVR